MSKEKTSKSPNWGGPRSLWLSNTIYLPLVQLAIHLVPLNEFAEVLYMSKDDFQAVVNKCSPSVRRYPGALHRRGPGWNKLSGCGQRRTRRRMPTPTRFVCNVVSGMGNGSSREVVPEVRFELTRHEDIGF